MSAITVVIPAYNEEERIAATIRAVRKLPGIGQLFVVNDGSSDQTSQVARQEGAEVIDLHPNRGKGGAMNASLAMIDGEVIVFLDADLGLAASEACKIIQPVVEGKCDLAIAAFPPPTEKGGFGLVKGTAAWALKRAGLSNSTAPLSGQRAMNRRALQILAPFYEAYGVELGMTIKALHYGLRVMEVPTTMSHKETGRDLQGFIHRGKQFKDVIKVLLMVRRDLV